MVKGTNECKTRIIVPLDLGMQEMQPYPLAKIFLAKLVRFGQN